MTWVYTCFGFMALSRALEASLRALDTAWP